MTVNGKAEPLYSVADFVGFFLCLWRVHAVYPLIRDKNILDLACGDNRLVRKNRKGKGVDITAYKNVDRVCENFADLPFQDGEFESATIIAALNYFDKPVEVLQEIRRVLKPDGSLIVTLLNENVSALWHRVREKEITPRPAYSEMKLRALLDKSGLNIEEKRYFMFGLNCIYVIKADPDPETVQGV